VHCNANRSGILAPVLAYIVRRLLYAVPILVGVNLLTFALFFVNTLDDMARIQLGVLRRLRLGAGGFGRADVGVPAASGLNQH